MNLLPPHLLAAVLKNPTAALTNRGLILKNANGAEELLVGVQNASTLYGEHFDQVRGSQTSVKTLTRAERKAAAKLDDPAPTPPALEPEPLPEPIPEPETPPTE